MERKRKRKKRISFWKDLVSKFNDILLQAYKSMNMKFLTNLLVPIKILLNLLIK